MAKIQTLKNNENNIIYPQTLIEAVFDTDNKSLKDLLSNYYSKEETDAAIQTYVEQNILNGSW